MKPRHRPLSGLCFYVLDPLPFRSVCIDLRLRGITQCLGRSDMINMTVCEKDVAYGIGGSPNFLNPS